MSKKTVILGATLNPSRYAYLAAERLTKKNHEIVPIGIKKGELFGSEILDLRSKPAIPDVDTVTMYIGPQNQSEWEDYILSLSPKRIIFNPGAENESLAQKASAIGIDVQYACTLVMLGNGLY
ncbi:CoA-binding protein [Ekhidna sp. To15]|uniref:CoA-binding protein n=1 Tax=Ekhidna sp. To15 TaxID=3395267 RepID=UPI003F5281C3